MTTATAPGITWSWSLFLLGTAFGLPAAIITVVDAPLGLAFAVGVVPAAISRLAPRRRSRLTALVVGTAAAASLVLGAVLTQVPVVAVIAIFVLGVGAVLWARRGRAGSLAVAICLPLVGIGLSFPDLHLALTLGLLIVLGSAYAWLVSLAWPEFVPQPPAAAATPPPFGAALTYGILLGAAGALAATIGYLQHLEHVGWATGACLLVMRPNRSLLFLRSAGRALSVIGGALLAMLVAVWDPSGWILGCLALVAVAAATATQASRWYVAPGFTTFLALSMIMRTSDASPADRFAERSLETLLGVGIALLFGWAIPRLIAAVASARQPPPTVG
jgi:hypothetical protein